MKNFTITLATTFCCLITVAGLSQSTITSAASGNWTSALTWVGNVVPTSNDSVIITGSHIVVVNDATPTCKGLNLSTTTAQLNMSAASSVLTLFGNLTINTTTAFSNWTAGAKIKFRGTADQYLLGWQTSTTPTSSLMEVIVDKDGGKLASPGNTFNGSATAGTNVKIGIGTSLDIIKGTFELGLDDDFVGVSRAGGSSATPTITVSAAGIFNMVGGTSYIRSRINTADDASKIGKLTVFGTANLAAADDGAAPGRRVNIGGIDIESGGLVEFPTGRSTDVGMFNPGTVNIKTGGTFKNNLITAFWYVNVTTPTTVVLNGGEFNFAASQTLPQVFSIPTGSGGIVRFSNSSAQTLPTAISTYENLILSNASVKTLGVNTIINGNLSLRGSATLSRGGFTLTYGPISTLQYGSLGQTTPQTASAEEWPVVNSPRNLTIYNTGNVTIPSSFDRSIAGTITLTAGNLVNNSVLTLISTSASTARVAALPVNGSGVATSTISGTINLQRYIPGKRAYRYLAHPFSSAVTIQQLQDSIDITGSGSGLTSTVTNAPSAYYQNINSAANWTPFTSATDVWNSYQGIAVTVRGKKGEGLNGLPYTPSAATIATRGAINQGSQIIALIANAANLPAGTGSSYRLIGNPFPSAVDMSLTTTRTNLSSAFYVWDVTLGNPDTSYGPGAYVAVPYTTSYAVPSSAGFFVKLTDSLQAGSITFPEASKTANATANQLFRNNAVTNGLNLQLESGSIIWDRMQFNFDDAASTSDEFLDANKLRNPQVSLFSWSSDNVELAIDNRPVDAGSVIKLGMAGLSSRSYSLSISNLDLPANLIAFVKDKYNGNTLTPIFNGGSFNFTVNSNPASAATDRFEIVFAPAAPLPVSLTNVAAYTKNAGVQIEWRLSSEMNMDKYVVERSANGIQFSAVGNVASTGNSSTSTTYNLFDATPLNGANFYRIKMIDKNGQAIYSKIVKVNVGIVKQSVTVFPNPVVNDYVEIQLNNLKAGDYTLRLSNASGQVIATKMISHAGGSASANIEMKQAAKGIYQLVISNNNENFTETIIRK